MADSSGRNNDGSSGGGGLAPWLKSVGELAAVLVPWFGAFVSSGDAKRWAFGSAAAISLCYVCYKYWRARHRPPKASQAPLPAIEKSLLRSFLPFEQGDLLLGRRGDIADALTKLDSLEFRFGVIWGESGCGKTSFIRAGLVPELARRGYAPSYLSRPTDDPVAAIDGALAQAQGRGRVIIFIDQFEEYFLTHASHAAASELGSRMQALLTQHCCSLVIAIRRDFFARLQHFTPHIPDPTSDRTTFELGNLSREAAQEILELAANEGQFEQALVDAVIEDLASNGEVWPVELQLIGTRLKRARIREKATYVTLGRKAGLIGTYIRDEVARLPARVLGEIILRKLCAPNGIAKSPVDVSLDAIAADVLARDPALIAGGQLVPCLRLLEEARIVIRTGNDTFNLTHDALAPLIQRGTTGLQGRTEAADRAISFYLGAYRHDRTVRIPLRTLRQIRRDATRETLADAAVRGLIARSWRSVVMGTLGPAVAGILVLIGVGYVVAFSTWSISTVPASFGSGPPTIALRYGNPYTRFLPGVDAVAEETSFAVDQLDSNRPLIAGQVPRGDLWGAGSMQGAVPLIADLLAPHERIAFLRLAGQPTSAVTAFSEIVRPRDKKLVPPDPLLRVVANSVGLAARSNGDALSTEVVEHLLRASSADMQGQGRLSTAATLGLLRMAELKPDIAERVTLTLSQALDRLKHQIIATDKSRILSSVRWNAVFIIAIINELLLEGARGPEIRDLEALELIIDDPKSDRMATADLYDLLALFAARNHELAVPALHYALRSAINPKPFVSVTGPLTAATVLAINHPNAVADPSIRQLLQTPALSSLDNRRLLLWSIPLSTLGRLDDAILPATFTEQLRAHAFDPYAPPEVRIHALCALSYLASARPRLHDSEAARQLRSLLHDALPEMSTDARERLGLVIWAAAYLAETGQLDRESAQIAMRSLGLAGRDPAAGANDLLVLRRDVSLKRLARAGADLDMQTIESMVKAVVESTSSSDASQAAAVLIVAAGLAPQQILKWQSQLETASYKDPINEVDRKVRLKVLAALGQADAAIGTKAEALSRCMAQLKTRNAAQTWQRGAFCAFFLALKTPAVLPDVTAALADLRKGGVAERMAATMALEMLVNVQRVADAKADPNRAPLVWARLRYDLFDRESHVSIAARAAQLALDSDMP